MSGRMRTDLRARRQYLPSLRWSMVMLASLFMKRHERRCYALSFKFWGEHTPLAVIGQVLESGGISGHCAALRVRIDIVIHVVTSWAIVLGLVQHSRPSLSFGRESRGLKLHCPLEAALPCGHLAIMRGKRALKKPTDLQTLPLQCLRVTFSRTKEIDNRRACH
ncbi:hypothetical protein FA13DRAFT_106897 [Coprinellus micaceus]|uniref:Uncharacterized protein n=1 Tax=Coprinellus micaceus TaxID=71717 RepID=A0A4Y7THP1_COPMI|nr:hypothetical protein FA13DRAFT_106897 [Coprinellus micaceus]